MNGAVRWRGGRLGGNSSTSWILPVVTSTTWCFNSISLLECWYWVVYRFKVVAVWTHDTLSYRKILNLDTFGRVFTLINLAYLILYLEFSTMIYFSFMILKSYCSNNIVLTNPDVFNLSRSLMIRHGCKNLGSKVSAILCVLCYIYYSNDHPGLFYWHEKYDN